MEFKPNECFVIQWLQKREFDESSITEVLKNQLDYFVRHHQIEKFHSWLFNCCRSINSSSDLHFFPRNFKLYYGNMVNKTLPLQAANTWMLFLEETLPASPVILELFICFLSNVGNCFYQIPKIILPIETVCLEATRKVLESFQMTMFDNDHIRLAAVLRLHHSWGNLVQISYGKNKSILEFSRTIWYHLGPAYNSGSTWKIIVEKCLMADPVLREIIFQLLLQKLSILSKAIRSESDPEVQQLCKDNLDSTIARIFTKLLADFELRNSLDICYFSSFLTDIQLNRISKLIFNKAIAAKENITSHLNVSNIKTSSNSKFILTILELIIERFSSNVPRNSEKNLEIFWYLYGQRFFDDSSGKLIVGRVEELRNLLQDGFQKKEMIMTPSPALNAIKLIDQLPLEHLQDEAQLKCSTFLISVAFSVGLDSEAAQLCISFLTPILRSNQNFCFYQVFPPHYFLKIFFKAVCAKENIPIYQRTIISLMIKKYFESHEESVVISTLSSLYNDVKKAPLNTRMWLTIILLKRSKDKELFLSQILVKDCLDLLYSHTFVGNDDIVKVAMIVILKYLPRKIDEESKQFNFLTSWMADEMGNICDSIMSTQTIFPTKFKLTIKLLVLMCQKSAYIGNLLTVFDKKSQLWSILFQNYPEIEGANPVLEEYDEDFLKDEDVIEWFKAIPIISKCIFENISSNFSLLAGYLDYTFKILRMEAYISEKLIAFRVIKGLINIDWIQRMEKDYRMSQFITSFLDELLFTMNMLFRNQNTSDKVSLTLIEAAFDLAQEILSRGIDLLNSSHLYYYLQMCSFVPLQRLIKSAGDYSKVLVLCSSIIHQILVNYNTRVKLSLDFIKDLLKNHLVTLIQISDESLFKFYTKKDQANLVESSLCFNKLLTADMTPFSTHLIIVYISYARYLNIQPLVKQNLTIFIYRLFNLIKSDEDWEEFNKMIDSQFDRNGRDYFHEMKRNYENFYKFSKSNLLII